MNFKDKRTRRICAASASAAVIVAGGVTVGATFANATGSLILATGSSFTTLDLGAAASAATASVQTLKATSAMASGDHFTLSYGGATTGNLTADSPTLTSDIQTALNSLNSVIGAGSVVVNKTGAGDLTGTTANYTITFNNAGLRTAITATVVSGAGALSVNSTTNGNSLGSNAGNISQSLANAVYATKVTTAGMSNVHVALDSYTAPASGAPVPAPALLVNHGAIGTANTPITGWEGVAVGARSTQTSTSVSDNVYVTANEPGTFKFHLVDDQGTPLATSDDVSSDQLTMNVLDVENVTNTTTADDWAPAVTAPASVVKGVGVTATVSFAGIDTTDARGANATGGLLGGYIAALTGISSTGSQFVGAQNATAVTYNGTGAYTTTTPTSIAAPLVSTATFAKDGSAGPYSVASYGFASPRTATTNVTDNSVTSIQSAATNVVGKVNQSGTAVAVLTGQADVTYTATVMDALADKSGKDFYFTLTKGTNSPALTADGTLVGTTNTTAVYKATTDSTGVAKLKVTSSVTTTGTSYGISVTTNNVAAVTSTATYATPTAGALQFTSTQSDLSPLAGGTASIKGQLLDQFLAPYTPQGNQPTQVQLYIGAAGGGAPVVANQSTSLATQTVPLVGGSFSYSYKPATAATAGQSTQVVAAYDTNADGTIQGGLTPEPTVPTSINWGSSVSAKTVSWLTPTANLANVKVATPTSLFIGALSTQVFGTTAADDGHVKGQLKDGSGNPLPFRPVTLSSSGGVYFTTAASPSATATPSTALMPTMDVVTDANGYFTAYAVFTKPGTVTIEAKSGGTATTPDADGTVVVTTAAGGNGYKVTVSSASALAGGNLPVVGTVADFFGNPVSGAVVSLTSSNPQAGSFFGTTATTDVNGNFNAAFLVASSTGDTTTTVTASLPGAATLYKLPSTNNWPTWGGPRVADGIQTATGKITVVGDAVSLTGPTQAVSAGNVTLSGKTKPGAKVAIYSVSDGRLQVASAMADNTTGAWSAQVKVSRNTAFQAETSTAVSSTITVHVASTVTLTAKPVKGVKGSVKVTVSGGPSKSAWITLWWTHGKKTTKVVLYVKGGSKTWVLKPGKGVTSFKAMYTSAGCEASGLVSAKVKL